MPLTSKPHLFKQLSFDVLVDFAPIMLISSSPSLVVVHPSVLARTVLELVDLARSKPGGLNYSSAGVGTNPHISGELFKIFLGRSTSSRARRKRSVRISRASTKNGGVW